MPQPARITSAQRQCHSKTAPENPGLFFSAESTGRVKGGTKAFRQRSRSEARATMRRVRQDESRGSIGSANQWCCESEEARAGRVNRRSLFKAAAASTGFDKTLSPARKNRGKWLSAAFRGLSAPSRLTLLFLASYPRRILLPIHLIAAVVCVIYISISLRKRKKAASEITCSFL